jgi:hypothetical protein
MVRVRSPSARLHGRLHVIFLRDGSCPSPVSPPLGYRNLAGANISTNDIHLYF